MKIRTILKKITSIPNYKFGDGYSLRVAKGLNLVLWMCVPVSISLFFALFFFDAASTKNLIMVTGFALVSLISIILLKKGLVWASLILMVAYVWLILSVDMIFFGFSGMVAGGQLILIFSVASTVSGWWGITVTLGTLILNIIFFWGKKTGILPLFGDISISDFQFVFHIIYTIMAGLFGNISNRTLLSSFSQAERNAERFWALFNLSQEAILLLDLDFLIIEANPQAAALFEEDHNTLIGKEVFKYIPKTISLDLEQLSQALLEYGILEPVDFKIESQGKSIHVEVYARLVKDDENIDNHIQVIIRDITEDKANVEALRHVAMSDDLTQLPNRRAFLYQLNSNLIKYNITGGNLAVFFMDINNFKTINDTYGHPVGDRVLEEYAKRLKKITRGDDFLARFGGDEFAVLVKQVPDDDILRKIAGRIIKDSQKELIIGEITIRLMVSIGISRFPEDSRSADALLHFADAAMYEAKEDPQGPKYIFYKDFTKKKSIN